MPKVLILGAGFGGVRCALDLEKNSKDLEIIIVDKNNYHTFQPALYEVASAFYIGDNFREQRFNFQKIKRSAAVPFGEIFQNRNIKFMQAEVKSVDVNAKSVSFTSGEVMNFDYLVLALGSETNYFGIPHLAEKSYPLKSVEDALNIKSAIDELFYNAKPDELIKIVIGGGGVAGSELAAELAGDIKKLAKKHKHLKNKAILTIIEASPNVLGRAAPWIINIAQKRLDDLGIKVLISKKIIDVIDHEVLFEGGEKVPFDVLIWTAGIKANSILTQIAGLEMDKTCKAVVDMSLQAHPHSNVFAIGDNTWCFDPESQMAAPAMVQTAINQGALAAKNILNLIAGRPLEKYKHKGVRFIIPLGKKFGIADLGKVHLVGFMAWCLKQLTFLQYFATILPKFKAIRFWCKEQNVFRKND
ncbi:MAG: Pyridine nucleotide-disulfide oxidoreductase family protein [Candidatus Moranbacteria bacterium GW2011_GWF2_37_7]|nr:MAG: Pyridine nucleotide-disulfide oxidoreductase family protein [Candidatus Moranbacteria bacterium GW2011_GWF2_37_7]